MPETIVTEIGHCPDIVGVEPSFAISDRIIGVTGNVIVIWIEIIVGPNWLDAAIIGPN